MKQQINTMLEMQDAMNTKVHDKWRAQNYEWYRAIWIESAELMDHFGWKWWKKQSPEYDQVVLELIDIWHFGLSIKLVEGVSADQLWQEFDDAFKSLEASPDFKKSVEAFSLMTLSTGSFDISTFVQLMKDIDLNFNQLYQQYVGKNVLNFFRQDHGYKTGEYVKVWNGKEDNEHLVEVLNRVDPNTPNYKDEIYNSLKAVYPLSLIHI